MALNLHENCKARLSETLKEALPRIKITHGMFIDRLSGIYLTLGDLVLPQTGKLHEQLLESINEFPFTDFVMETIGSELWEQNKYDTNSESADLCSIQGYEDPAPHATRLVEAFDSLPWKYQLSFVLPKQLSGLLSPGQAELALSDVVRLVRAKDQFAQQFSLMIPDKRRQGRMKGGSGLLSLLFEEPPVWDPEAVCFQVQMEGFVGQYGGSSTTERAERLLRAFCGLGIAVRLFKHQHKLPQGATKSYYYVHRLGPDGAWNPESRLDVNDTIDRGMLGLELHTLDGTLVTDEQKFGWALHRLQSIAAAFSAAKKAEQIILAAQWLFDSHAGRDELLSFVQSMVVLEILLGDKKISDEIGIGELMRNRCAYLIGSSQEERTDLLKAFNDIYRVRSQIVHSGKHRLTLQERTLFSRLRWMCRRVIDKELELLQADLKAEAEKRAG